MEESYSLPESLSGSLANSTQLTLGCSNSWIEMEAQEDNSSNSHSTNDDYSEESIIYNIQGSISEEQFDIKLEQIKIAYESQDIKALGGLAKSFGGLLSMEWRRKIWPILLGVDDFEACLSGNSNISTNTSTSTFTDNDVSINNYLLGEHVDENQVQLDVNRAFVFYPPDGKEDQDSVNLRKKELGQLIVTVLRRNPQLRYYQGYHDISQVLYLVYGQEDAVKMLEFISLFYLRDFMMPTLTPSVDQLELIPALLELADHPLAELLSETKPFFALSSILTIFSHDISSFDGICYIFDYVFACKNMLAPLFLYVSLIIHRRDDLLPLDVSDSDIIHSKLSQIPSPLSLSSLLEVTTMADYLIGRISPSQLGEPWNTISPYSVLKTTAVLQPNDSKDFEKSMSQSGYMDGSTLIINGIRKENAAEDSSKNSINTINHHKSNTSLNTNENRDSGSESPDITNVSADEPLNSPISPISSNSSTHSFDLAQQKLYLSREDILILSQQQIKDLETREQIIKEQRARELELRRKAQEEKRAKNSTNNKTTSTDSGSNSKGSSDQKLFSASNSNSIMRYFLLGENRFSRAYYTRQNFGIFTRNGLFSTSVCVGLLGILAAWYCHNNRIDLLSEIRIMWRKFRI